MIEKKYLNLLKQENDYYLNSNDICIKYRFGKRTTQIILLHEIPHDETAIHWCKSAGCTIYYRYNDLYGEIKILDYVDQFNLIVQCDKKATEFAITNIRVPSLGVLINQKRPRTQDFMYNIGEIIETPHTKLKILNRKTDNGTKKYYMECLSCHSKRWRSESHINRSIGKYICNVCMGREYLVGYNDITITDPWMIPYFQGGEEEARQYTSSSKVRKIFRCPYCHQLDTKERAIIDLHRYHGFACICNNSWSYPERLIAEMLSQNNIKFMHNCSMPWSNNKKYDFILPDYYLIIEADGELGHGNYQPGKTYEQSEIEIEQDSQKDMMAIQNGFFVYRIEYFVEFKKDFPMDLQNALPSFLWKNTNWHEAQEKAEDNKKLYICQEYEQSNKDMKAIQKLADKYHYHPGSIRSILKMGTYLGWCDYPKHKQIRKSN